MTLKSVLAEAQKALEESGIGSGPLDAKGRTRARVLRSAMQLFQRRGYRHTSIDDVARDAGVAKGTVYVHFKNKAEMLFHAIAEEKKQLVERFQPLLQADLAPEERLRRYLELSLRVIPEAPLVSKLMSGDRELLVFLEELDPELAERTQKLQLNALTALAAGIGGWDLLDPREREDRIIALRGLLLSFGPMLEERVRGGLSIERYAEQLAKIISHGLGAP